MKKAFTLAEIMIVLTIIGILTSILLPNAIKSMPDENVMKFKKAHNTLAQAIGELVSNEKYYLNGDLSLMPDGTEVNSIKYFCKTIADLLSLKSNECSSLTSSDNSPYDIIENLSFKNVYGAEWHNKMTEAADDLCKKLGPKFGNELILSDGVHFYEANPNTTFSIRCAIGDNGGCSHFDPNGPIHRFKFYSEAGKEDSLLDNDNIYKVFCIDVDGVPTNATSSDCVNECPFGYGIRVDGKILNGKRANEWIQKSVQQKE